MKKLITILVLIGFSVLVESQSIVDTKHNLSITGPGTVKAVSEEEICLFCHTAHNSVPQGPLWNRNNPGSTYTLYSSSTLKALPTQPSGSSILCLSCHDGTIALGSVLSRSTTISFASAVNMPAGASNLSTDLRNDHPISFTYDAALAALNTKIKAPSALPTTIKLENNQLQCTSCHDPHKNLYSDFLVASTQNGGLCNACHQQPSWTASAHNTSTKTWNQVAPNPWPYTPWTTVADNACASCHNSHNAGSTSTLLKYQAEESNCLDCHNGNAATKNVAADFAKAYKHNVYGYTGIHNPNETGVITAKHVECIDCHNPHMAKTQTAVAPAVKGSLIGVSGVNQAGAAVSLASYEYEVCYKCHSDNAATVASTNRVIVQNNTRLEFAATNPSFHSVAAIGVNTSVPSLISPWTVTSRMYCSDCHASSGTNVPGGPHGSIYPQILKLQYLKTDNTTYNAANFALCYSCHSATSIMNNASFKYHNKHINDIKTSCNTCHDAHGISNLQGTAANNSNLINFNTAYVTASNGIIRFIDTGVRKGSCQLICHGKNHNPYTY